MSASTAALCRVGGYPRAGRGQGGGAGCGAVVDGQRVTRGEQVAGDGAAHRAQSDYGNTKVVCHAGFLLMKAKPQGF
ncbi:MAG: hypothetical protein WDN04_05425 [Rhodospirillales bacterium]